MRAVFVAMLLALTIGPAAPLAFAQDAVRWDGGYPQLQQDTCVWYVARWADGTYTETPWTCPAGATPVREDGFRGADRGYPEQRDGGCIWYVTRWQDGSYTAVPFSCPAGVTATKSGQTIAAPGANLSPPSGAPTPVPTGPGEQGLQTYPLHGTLIIDELTPPLGTQIAANGRLFIVYRHYAENVPEGWRVGYRVWGTYTTKAGETCNDCYQTEGTQGNPRGYFPNLNNPATITWTSRPDIEVTYSSMRLCFTLINPNTNELRLTPLCVTKSI